MPTGLGDRILPRLTALLAVWFMAVTVDREGDHWWLILCFVGIALVLEFLAFRHGVATGIMLYKNMTPTQRQEIDRIIKDKS